MAKKTTHQLLADHEEELEEIVDEEAAEELRQYYADMFEMTAHRDWEREQQRKMELA